MSDRRVTATSGVDADLKALQPCELCGALKYGALADISRKRGVSRNLVSARWRWLLHAADVRRFREAHRD